MLIFFICLIIFISLGIPDGVLSSVWPVMSHDIGVNPGILGIVGAIVFAFSFITTLFYPYFISKYSLSKIIIASIFLLLIGFICYLFSYNHIFLYLGAVFLGLGAGCIDTGINEYAVKNFSVKLINVLHAFYAIGVSLGAFLSSYVFYLNRSWEATFILIILILLFIVFIVFLYRKVLVLNHNEENTLTNKAKGVYLIFSFYFIYAIEIVASMFISSYIFFELDMAKTIASFSVFMFWAGIFFGRVIVTITSKFLKNTQILISSIIICIIASLCILLINVEISVLVCSFLIGFGFGPIYPTMLAQITNYYKEEELSNVISIQMMGILLGGVILPIIAGFIFSNINYYLLPVSIIICMVLLLFNIYLITKKVSNT